MRGSNGGPKTEKGRAIARLNALKHGFAAKSPVIPDIEDEDEWLRYHAGIVASLSPEGHLEEVLTWRLANILWHLDRLTAYEVAAIMRHIESTAIDLGIAANYLSDSKEIVQPKPEDIAERQQGRLLPSDSDLERVMRYGSHLHRQWVQTLHELEALQARRRGEPAHLARLDISSPPAG
ncbi:MAG: hypothetical protein U1B78_03200 [Dehalococcoidia bacterium]|nr:hypothetical protein [Dehalococcoidia bacterium]